MTEIIIRDEAIIYFFKNSLIDPEKFIQTAIEHKDYLLQSETLSNTFSRANETNKISLVELTKIKNEYMAFTQTRDEIKEKTKELNKLIDHVKFSDLYAYLSTKYVLNTNKLKCPHCEEKTFLTKRALAGHTNKCKNRTDELVNEIEDNKNNMK
jgi:hypothetical protein